MTPRSNEAADILRLQASLIGSGDRPSDRTLAEALEHGAKEIDRLAATSAVRQEPAGARAGDGKALAAPFGWALLCNNGTTADFRPRVTDFFGAIHEREAFTAEDARRRDRDWPGLAPHRIVVLLAAAPAVSAPAWQPIETAPRGSGEDGPHDVRDPAYIEPPTLLLWTQEGPRVGYYDWYYHPGYGRGADPHESPWRCAEGGQAYGPTHWQPLPAAPGSKT